MEKITFKEIKNIEKIDGNIVKEETIEEYISSNGNYISIHLVNGRIHKRFYGVIGETYRTKKEISASDMHHFKRELFK